MKGNNNQPVFASLLSELHALQRALVPWLVSLAAVGAYTFAGPSPWQTPVSAIFIQRVRRDLLPADVTLVSLSPADGFVTRVWVSLLLAVVATSPLLILRLAAFLAPALTPYERHALAVSTIPMLGLFVAGSFFAYTAIIPLTIRFLYDVTRDIGIGQFISLPSFVGFVAGVVVVVGLLFELPVVIVGATAVGLVRPTFWSSYGRHAIIGFLILTAVITPDGTGVTMLILALPLIALYAIGTVLAKRFFFRKEEVYG